MVMPYVPQKIKMVTKKTFCKEDEEAGNKYL